MGSVRGFEYDAVIGVGAITAGAKSFGIDGRINWVGIGPRKDWSAHAMRVDPRGPQVTFDKFALWEDAGPFLLDRAPMLARRFYERNARFLLTGSSIEEQREAESILRLAGKFKGRPSSSGAICPPAKPNGRCPPRKGC